MGVTVCRFSYRALMGLLARFSRRVLNLEQVLRMLRLASVWHVTAGLLQV